MRINESMVGVKFLVGGGGKAEFFITHFIALFVLINDHIGRTIDGFMALSQ